MMMSNQVIQNNSAKVTLSLVDLQKTSSWDKNMTKPSIEDMWFYIDEVMSPHGDIGDRTKMNYDQVFQLYSVVKESYSMFKMLAQISVLKRTIAKHAWLKSTNLNAHQK